MRNWRVFQWIIQLHGWLIPTDWIAKLTDFYIPSKLLDSISWLYPSTEWVTDDNRRNLNNARNFIDVSKNTRSRSSTNSLESHTWLINNSIRLSPSSSGDVAIHCCIVYNTYRHIMKGKQNISIRCVRLMSSTCIEYAHEMYRIKTNHIKNGDKLTCLSVLFKWYGHWLTPQILANNPRYSSSSHFHFSYLFQ